MTATLSGPSIADCKERIREMFKAENHQPVPDKLIQKLIFGINNESEVLLVDAGCVIALSLIEQGHNPDKIFVAEDSDGEYIRVAEKLSEIYGFHLIRINVNKMPPIMKFDYTLANPPFKGQLHLEFLQNALKISKNVKFIHPSGWLTRSGKKIERDVKLALHNRLRKLTLFNGYPVFNAEFQGPLVITEADPSYSGKIEVYYDNTSNTYYIDSLDSFPTGYWEPTDENYELRDLIYGESQKSNILSLRTSNPNKIPLSLPVICGDPRSKDKATFVRKDFWIFFYPNSDMYNNKHAENQWYSFNTESERDSFVSYLKTKFARFALALNKTGNRNNISRYIKNVPLPPLNTIWTEDSIMEYYGLTQQQKNQINQFIPTYYK